MVFFFIADLALSLALKATTWCLGKTYDGIVYLVSHKNKTNDHNDRNDGDDFVVISREDYRALRRNHGTIKQIDNNDHNDHNDHNDKTNATTPNPTHEEVSVSVSVPDVVSSSASSK